VFYQQTTNTRRFKSVEVTSLQSRGFPVLFFQLKGKCQGKPRKDGARLALFLVIVLLYGFFVLFYVFCVLYIVCFVTFPVLFVCICVQNNCHRVATQLQLNISYIYIYKIKKNKIIQINHPTKCNSFTSLLHDVFVWLNMFWALPRPSSGA
jgi:hypothetical protein